MGASGGHDGDEDTFEDALEDEFSVPRDEVLRLYSVRDAPVDPLFTPTVVRTTAVVPKELPVTVKDADLALPVVDVREVKRVHAPPPSSTTPTQVPSREVRGSTDKVAEQDPRQEVDSQAFASVVCSAAEYVLFPGIWRVVMMTHYFRITQAHTHTHIYIYI